MVAASRACPCFPPRSLHGKEGVDGSSPSEGLQNPRSRGFFVQMELRLTQRAVGMEPLMEPSVSECTLQCAGNGRICRGSGPIPSQTAQAKPPGRRWRERVRERQADDRTGGDHRIWVRDTDAADSAQVAACCPPIAWCVVERVAGQVMVRAPVAGAPRTHLVLPQVPIRPVRIAAYFSWAQRGRQVELGEHGTD